MANKAQGKGYENENNYQNIQFHFIGIENIHVMRNSLQKLVECILNLCVQILKKTVYLNSILKALKWQIQLVFHF